MWFKMDVDVVDGYSVDQLISKYRMSENEAAGLIVRFYAFCIRNRIEDGDITTIDPIIITKKVGLQPTSNAIKILTDVGVILEDIKPGCPTILTIKDWVDFGGSSLQETRLKTESGRRGGIASGKSRRKASSKASSTASKDSFEQKERKIEREKERQTDKPLNTTNNVIEVSDQTMNKARMDNMVKGLAEGMRID